MLTDTTFDFKNILVNIEINKQRLNQYCKSIVYGVVHVFLIYLTNIKVPLLCHF